METPAKLIGLLELKQTKNGGLDATDTRVLSALYEQRDRDLQQPKAGEQYYKKPDAVPFRGVVDLFCLFAEKLELAMNEPTMKWLETRIPFLDEEVQELKDAQREDDLVEMLDGAGDVAFVAITHMFIALRRKGFSHLQAELLTNQILIEIGRSNAVKIVPEEAGAKIKKPEGWRAPRIAEIIKRNEIECDPCE